MTVSDTQVDTGSRDLGGVPPMLESQSTLFIPMSCLVFCRQRKRVFCCISVTIEIQLCETLVDADRSFPSCRNVNGTQWQVVQRHLHHLRSTKNTVRKNGKKVTRRTLSGRNCFRLLYPSLADWAQGVETLLPPSALD